MNGYMNETKRNERRDKKVRKARFAPHKGGLPKGNPKAAWARKNAEAKQSR